MNDIEELKSELLSDSGLIAVSTGKGEIRIEGQMTHLATALVAGTVLGFSLSLIGEENEISARRTDVYRNQPGFIKVRATFIEHGGFL